MHFCGNNVVVIRCFFAKIRCIFLETPFVVIDGYIIHIEKGAGKGRKLCENTKRGHEQKTNENHCFKPGCPKCGVRTDFT